MDRFDYNAQAELFTGRLRMSRTQTVGDRRFDHAVDAIRFAIEDLWLVLRSRSARIGSMPRGPPPL
jgi:hypothetical protein